jgi:diphthine-ammonia ligase
MKVITAWSGGKDCCFACYKAIKKGHAVQNLLTFMSAEGRSNFHDLPSEILDAHSKSVGIPIFKQPTTKDTYEQNFKKALLELKQQGAEGLVTGDVYEVPKHEEGWLERICKEVGLEPIKPLWLQDTRKILQEFIDQGFGATVVKVDTTRLGLEWLGREINQQFFDDIIKLDGIDPCGEGGEYHTCIIDGPIFKNRIEIVDTQRVEGEGFGFLNIKNFLSIPKLRS